MNQEEESLSKENNQRTQAVTFSKTNDNSRMHTPRHTPSRTPSELSIDISPANIERTPIQKTSSSPKPLLDVRTRAKKEKQIEKINDEITTLRKLENKRSELNTQISGSSSSDYLPVSPGSSYDAPLSMYLKNSSSPTSNSSKNDKS